MSVLFLIRELSVINMLWLQLEVMFLQKCIRTHFLLFETHPLNQSYARLSWLMI